MWVVSITSSSPSQRRWQRQRHAQRRIARQAHQYAAQKDATGQCHGGEQADLVRDALSILRRDFKHQAESAEYCFGFLERSCRATVECFFDEPMKVVSGRERAHGQVPVASISKNFARSRTGTVYQRRVPR